MPEATVHPVAQLQQARRPPKPEFISPRMAAQQCRYGALGGGGRLIGLRTAEGKAAGWQGMADPLSGARWSPGVVATVTVADPPLARSSATLLRA